MQNQKSSPKEVTFGGFKKGFLNNAKARKEKNALSSISSRKDNDIPVLKPKYPMKKNRGIEIAEVQEAMKSKLPSLENEG